MIELSVRQLNAMVENYSTDKALQSDREATEVIAVRAPQLLLCASQEFLNDEQIAMLAVKSDGQSLRFFTEEIRSNSKIVLLAVENFCKSFAFALGEARENVDIAKAVARRGGESIALLDSRFLDDTEIAQIAIARNPRSLVYFSERVRSDEKTVLFAISKDRTAVEFVADDAFKNKKIFEKSLRMVDGKIPTSTITAKTPQGVFNRIEEIDLKFNLASQNLDLYTLDRDKLVVCLKCGLGAILKKGELLHKYIEKEDKEIVQILLERTSYSPKVLMEEVKFASQSRKLRVLPILLKATGGINAKTVKAKDDRMFLLRSLRRKSPTAINRLKENISEYLSDKEVMFTLAWADGTVLKILKGTEYLKNNEFITECLRSYVVKNSDGALLEGMNIILTDEQAKIACQKDGRNYFYLSEEQKNDVETTVVAVRSNASVYESLPDYLKDNPLIKRERDLWIR